MKKLNLMAVALFAAIAFSACGGASSDSKEKADSANTAKDSAANDTTGSTKMSETMATDKDDAEFATAAANGGMAEVALGKLAEEKTANAKVKEFAKMMVTDHGKANDELIALAKSKNITLPAAPSDEKVKEKEELSAKTGAEFDKAYVDAMVDGHKKTVTLFEDEVKNGKDADLKAFAAKTLPTLKAHYTHIQAIHDALK